MEDTDILYTNNHVVSYVPDFQTKPSVSNHFTPLSFNNQCVEHIVFFYLEYHNVGTGTSPTPLPQASVPPPLNQRGGGGTLACRRGVGGVPIQTTGEKA
jgi:hypothetical protein